MTLKKHPLAPGQKRENLFPFKRTWYISCSPRDPVKLAPEVELMSRFEGRVWNDVQTDFAAGLKALPSFEGSVSTSDPRFSARDRAAPQKTFGFVKIDSQGKVRITSAGQELITGVRPKELFLRQLLKWQYPSYQHHGPEYFHSPDWEQLTRGKVVRTGFWTLPFVDTLGVVQEVDGLTKSEMAIFMLPRIRMSAPGPVAQAIQDYRRALERRKGRLARREFRAKILHRTYSRLYDEEHRRIARLRGSARARKEIATRAGSALDVADAAIRHFRNTPILTIGEGGRLTIPSERERDVVSILSLRLKPVLYFLDLDRFYAHIGDSHTPTLPWDNRDALAKRVRSLVQEVKRLGVGIKGKPPLPSVPAVSGLSLAQLKQVEDQLTVAGRDLRMTRLIEQIRSRPPDEIIQRYDLILHPRNYDEVVFDPPLDFEWTTFRALVALDHGTVHPNTVVDDFFHPQSHAAGGRPDLVASYPALRIAIEVTLKTGSRQYKDEGEPVTDHVGKFQLSSRIEGFVGPVVGLFIAPEITTNSLQWFFLHRSMSTPEYGGSVTIIPLTLGQFLQILESRRSVSRPLSEREFCDLILRLIAQAASVPNHSSWIDANQRVIADWSSSLSG